MTRVATACTLRGGREPGNRVSNYTRLGGVVLRGVDRLSGFIRGTPRFRRRARRPVVPPERPQGDHDGGRLRTTRGKPDPFDDLVASASRPSSSADDVSSEEIADAIRGHPGDTELRARVLGCESESESAMRWFVRVDDLDHAVQTGQAEDFTNMLTGPFQNELSARLA